MTEKYKSIPVAEARAAVQASGELEGFEGPHFLSPADPDWRPYFRVTEDAAHPEFASVKITRKGQKPREVVISWDEYTEQMDDPEWDEIRERKPMSVFGAECERHAYRVVFADVLAALDRPVAPPASVQVPARDYLADVAAAVTADEVAALFAEARAAGAVTGALSKALQEKLAEINAAPPPVAEPRPAAPSPAQIAGKAKPLTVQPPKHTGPRRRSGKRPQRGGAR